MASTEEEKQAMCRKRKKTAALAALRWPVFWKMDTVMHSPIKATTEPAKPNTMGQEMSVHIYSESTTDLAEWDGKDVSYSAWAHGQTCRPLKR